jgi:hypothetical protein
VTHRYSSRVHVMIPDELPDMQFRSEALPGALTHPDLSVSRFDRPILIAGHTAAEGYCIVGSPMLLREEAIMALIILGEKYGRLEEVMARRGSRLSDVPDNYNRICNMGPR